MSKASRLFLELVDKIIYSTISSSNTKRWRGKPGDYVFNLPEEQRKILQDLKSEDIENLTPNPIFAIGQDKL